MKYLLAFLALVFLTSPALADGPPDFYEKSYRPGAEYYKPRKISLSYERRLRREYEQFQREQAALNRKRRKAKKRRARDAEVYYYQERRSKKRSKPVEWRESRAERRARERREAKALADERARYDRQRRRYAANDRYYEEDYRPVARARGPVCLPEVVAYGQRARLRPRAEKAARLSWAAEVRARHDNRYADPGRARDKHYVCDPIEGTWPKLYECQLYARPCRAEF